MSNSSAQRKAVSMVRRVAPVSSCTFSPHTFAPMASRIASPRDVDPRPSSPTLTGNWSIARSPRSSTQAEPRPTPHIGPASWPITVVTPEEISASKTRGLSVCTCVSIPPGVAMRPSPSMTAVPVPTTMSIASVVPGLPALPMPAMRPSLMPMLATRTPSTGSSTTTFVMSRSQDSRADSACRPMPSRPVLANPTCSSSPRSSTRSVIRRRRRVSPRITVSPASGP
jgi:hypothetical protein